ncbi:MAG: hypothetical protein L6Q26_06765 [Anaerolineales bacterium]|nr:hypothetical protein [Anaerolineales bacterium]NUQ84007.1 hypothetical protein [Anaerolineales bacterium]
MTTATDDTRIKDLFKEAMLELLTERRDDFYELFAEALEDVLLVYAIREGEDSEAVSKEEVLRALGGAG